MWKSNNPNLKPTWRQRAGFTLWEVVVAMTVLIIGILSLARLFPLAIKISSAAEQTTIAINLAQAKIEEIFYLGYANISCSATTSPYVSYVEIKNRLATNPQNPFYYFWRQTTCAYVNGSDLSIASSDTGLKKIVVTVYWQSPVLAQEKSREVIILISKR